MSADARPRYRWAAEAFGDDGIARQRADTDERVLIERAGVAIAVSCPPARADTSWRVHLAGYSAGPRSDLDPAHLTTIASGQAAPHHLDGILADCERLARRLVELRFAGYAVLTTDVNWWEIRHPISDRRVYGRMRVIRARRLRAVAAALERIPDTPPPPPGTALRDLIVAQAADRLEEQAREQLPRLALALAPALSAEDSLRVAEHAERLLDAGHRSILAALTSAIAAHEPHPSLTDVEPPFPAARRLASDTAASA